MSLLNRLRALFKRRELENNLDEELKFHVEMKTRENLAAGMPPKEARNAALRQFGNVPRTKEATRTAWSFPRFETFLQDIRYGLRQLLRSRGFAIVVVITLALGIGVNTVIFSLVNTLMLRKLPVQDPDQLVQFLMQGFGSLGSHFSYPDFEHFRDDSRSFTGVTAVFWLNATLLDANLDGQPEDISGQMVSGNFFPLLGLHPAAGRLITPDDDKVLRGHPVAVLSYGYWTRRFGRSPSVVGKSISLHNAPFTIVGVVPPGFAGVTPGFAPDLYVPFMMEPVFHTSKSWLDQKAYHWVQILGRLKPSANRQQALAELRVLHKQTLDKEVKPDWSSKDREEFLAQRMELTSAASGFSEMRREYSRPIGVLAGMVGLVLLIACANVASLLLARAIRRQREFAVRLALGAARRRLVRQLLTESLLLGLLGGALGLGLAWGSSGLLTYLISLGTGHVQMDLHLDGRVVAFTALISILTTVLFGLAPALRATRLNLTPTLKENPRTVGLSGGHLRLGKPLVVAQVALCSGLVFGAGLFVRTLRNLETLDPGFDRRNVLLLSVDPTRGGYRDREISDLYRRILGRLDSLPGVRSASLAAITPIWGGGWNMEIWAQGYNAAANEDVTVNLNSVSPRYFETLRTPLLLGRDFGPQDTEKSPKVALINRAMAGYFFGKSNPIGKRFGWVEEGGVKRDFEIIGVVGDAKYMNMREPPPRTAYLDCFQDTPGGLSFEVRTAMDPAGVAPAIRSVVETLAPGAQLSGLKTLDEQVEESLGHERLIATLSGLFGALALALAALGLYGMMAYAVEQRINEIGIRMALGAGRLRVLESILRESLVLVSIGVILGLPAALATARFVSSMLYGLKSADPGTMIWTVIVLGMVALLASYIPARRATKVDPMEALRYE